ncbi:ArnT family glycosyltransferase [Sphaerisporangium perillae]|uniref:ArnT family glycosyltransferase n=1 Tax=Sphaerisporangium perillae TaxID=2935860 RepID=UPI00200E9135|nr:glycosyltransferase family 39 protein [Sphaerisporangium perillae]
MTIDVDRQPQGEPPMGPGAGQMPPGEPARHDTGPAAEVPGRDGASGHRRTAPRSRLASVVLGGAGDPRWARPALIGVLALAAVLYTWALGRNGYANQYYAAAVLSGTHSWKAFFFGAIDSASFITVDKPPFGLWVMGLSARIFGFGTWSMLLPQAVAGIAAVGLVHSAVRRALGGVQGHAAGLVAALVMTLTPITVAINRDNNPDTILVLLLVAAAWCCAEAIRTGRMRTLVFCAVLVGVGFNTKMLQAYLVLPAFALVYLYAAPGRIARRVGHLLAAGAALVVSSAWWMVVVDLWPAADRPYIGGSTDNTVWDLVVGYNGLGRIFGGDGNGGGGGRGGFGGGGGFGGASGADRMFNDVIAGQISWLLPFAVLALAAGLLLAARRPGPLQAGRRSAPRAALLLWGGWLAVHFIVFSFSAGTFHPYYTTALAPAIAALTGLGGVLMWQAYRRTRAWAWVLPAGIALTGAWAFAVLRRTPDWTPWLAYAVAGLCAIAAVGLIVLRLGGEGRARFAALALVIGLVGGLAAPAAYALTPLSSGVNGTNPTAGPEGSGGFGGMGGRGGMPGAMRGQFPGGQFPGGRFPGGQDGPGTPPAGAEPSAGTDQPSGADMLPGTEPPAGSETSSGADGRGRGGFGGGPGGNVGSEMISYLEKNQGDATWLLAVSSAQSASSVILSTGGEPVIAMGGFTGSDPAMTVAKLEQYVSSGQLKYILLGGGMGGPDRGGDNEITTWVQANGTVVDPSEYGGTDTGQPLYKLG